MEHNISSNNSNNSILNIKSTRDQTPDAHNLIKLINSAEELTSSLIKDFGEICKKMDLEYEKQKLNELNEKTTNIDRGISTNKQLNSTNKTI